MSWTRRAFLGRAAAAAAVPAAVVAAVKIGESVPPAKAGNGTSVTTGAGARSHSVPWTVKYENSLPGYKNWRIKNQGAPDAIMGFASQASIRPGEPVHLYVSTTSREFSVKAFRMGWYNHDLARLLWQSGPLRGHRQAPARFAGADPDGAHRLGCVPDGAD